jgi:hypothetical protein
MECTLHNDCCIEMELGFIPLCGDYSIIWIPACSGTTDKTKEPLRSGSFFIASSKLLS